MTTEELYQELNKAIEAYHIANDALEAAKAELGPKQKLARARVQVLAENLLSVTGETKYKGEAGQVTYVMPTETVSYDAQALDKMLDEHPWLKALRKEGHRSGYVKIG